MFLHYFFYQSLNKYLLEYIFQILKYFFYYLDALKILKKLKLVLKLKCLYKSLAYYYYTTERFDEDVFDKHSTLFLGDKINTTLKKIIKSFIPPIFITGANKIIKLMKK